MISPVSDSVLAIGVLELELCTVHLAFIWALGLDLGCWGSMANAFTH